MELDKFLYDDIDDKSFCKIDKSEFPLEFQFSDNYDECYYNLYNYYKTIPDIKNLQDEIFEVFIEIETKKYFDKLKQNKK